MSAKDQMTKLLDQLMGQNRDGEELGREKHFTDKEVCKPFLLGICINDLFVNTRAELPECTKVHSVTLKDQFEEASKRRDYRIEEEVYAYLQSFLKDNERKIESAKKRLTLTQETPEMEEKVEQIHELAVQVGEKVAKAEALGAEGKVDESLAMMAEVEEIKGKKKTLEDEYHAAIPRHAAQQQKLRACEVCGAFLSMYDNDRRLADHFGGKLHIGFVTIREKIKQLEDAIKAKEEKRKKEREDYYKEREQRDKERSRRSRSGSRERRRRRSRSRSRERDRDRRRDSYRERGDRDRDSYRERERDRERDRDRDRDRDRRRSRSRSRERRRRSRSRSRERYRRERSES